MLCGTGACPCTSVEQSADMATQLQAMLTVHRTHHEEVLPAVHVNNELHGARGAVAHCIHGLCGSKQAMWGSLQSIV